MFGKTKPAFKHIRLRPEMVITHSGEFYPHAEPEIGRVEQVYYTLVIDCMHHNRHELYTGNVDSHTGGLNLFHSPGVYFNAAVQLQMVELFDQGKVKFYDYIEGELVEVPGHVPVFVQYWKIQEVRESTEPKFNKMKDSGFCECGGKYEHVDLQEDKEAGTVDDSYQCNQCETWCIVTWNRETQEEIKRSYEL